MKTRHFSVLAGLSAALLWAASADASTVTIGLQDPTAGPAITTVATGTNAANYGSVSTFFGNFNIQSVSATDTVTFPNNDFTSNTIDIASSLGGTINVWVTVQNVGIPFGTSINFQSGFTLNNPHAMASVTETTFLDNSNGLFGGTTLNSQVFTGVGSVVKSTNHGTNPTYSLTELFQIVVPASPPQLL